ncbi:TTC18, partial [Acrasis kona]
TKGKVDKEQFVFHLNNSGKYFSFKEKLKTTVVQIVKEKFARQAAKKNEVEKFYNDLYVYLIQQMHITINRIFDSANETEFSIIGADGTPTDKWRRLADEAEAEGNYALAVQYHQDRISSAQDDFNAELMYEYGMFSLRVNDLPKAEHSLREAISIDMSHTPSLRAYGCLLISKEQYKEAEVFLQSIVDLCPNDATCWGCLGLFFKYVNKEKESHQANMMGERCFLESSYENGSTFYTTVASYLLDIHLDKLAELALSDEENKGVEYCYNMARVFFIRQQYDQVEQWLTKAINQDIRCEKVWHLMGRSYAAQENSLESLKAYETAMSVAKESTDPLLYLRVGKIYLELERFEDAKSTYLLACKYWPCGIAWLGVGISYYRLEDMVHAEQCLNEANIQNNLDPNVWAYLTLVCIRQERFEEAEKALKESLRHQLKNGPLKDEVSQLYQSIVAQGLVGQED